MNIQNILRIMLLLLTTAAVEAHADEASDYHLKSDFIYNFATYVNWPELQGKPLVLCVAAPQAVVEPFHWLEGKPIGNTTISMRYLDSQATPAGCQILFVTESESDDLKTWLPALGGSPTLTMTESEKWVKQGAMIGLQVEGARVVFVVNADAARAAGIDINSRVLRLARKVYGKETTDGAK